MGYGEHNLMFAPVVANADIYKPYELTEEEQREYGCDICMVCHAADVDAYIRQVRQRFPEKGKAVAGLYMNFQEDVYERELMLFNTKEAEQYIRRKNKEQFQKILTEAEISLLAEDLVPWFSTRVYRQVLADWLIDAGFTNLKLWGNGWKDSPKYEKYAMGPAENGETLSKINQAAKIVLGNNCAVTAVARVWETMLSGGFYLGNYVPPEDDYTDIRRILTVGEEMVMFDGRKDLLSKVRHYLAHEDERQEMIRRGRKAALERMTYDQLMKRLLEKLAERVA